MGCGRVGSRLARSLEKRGHTVAVIDLDSEAFRRLGPDFAGKTVRGVGFDREVLLEAGIEDAPKCMSDWEYPRLRRCGGQLIRCCGDCCLADPNRSGGTRRVRSV
jgi:hypothetical protein